MATIMLYLAECRVLFIVMLIVVMLSVVMLIVVMLIVVMLSVMAPWNAVKINKNYFFVKKTRKN
jgi:hypothetical protein